MFSGTYGLMLVVISYLIELQIPITPYYHIRNERIARSFHALNVRCKKRKKKTNPLFGDACYSSEELTNIHGSSIQTLIPIPNVQYA